MGRAASPGPAPDGERGARSTGRARPVPGVAGDVAVHLLDHLERSPDLVAVVDPDGDVRYLNRVARDAVARAGLERDRLSLADLVEPDAYLTYQDLVRPALLRDEVWQGPLRLRLDADQERWVTVTAADGSGGGGSWLVAAARPSSLDRPHPGDQLARGRDELTGLTTRGGLAERLEVALARARRSGRPVAVAFVDLDDLKAINDQFGHYAGDVVLTEVAHRLSDAVRAIDLVARTGGDEFVVVFDGVEDDDEAEALLVRLQAAVESGAVRIDDGQVHVSVSVGIATSHGHDAPEVLLRRADAAMYDAKGERRRAPDRAERRWADGEAPSVRDVAVALTQGHIAPGYWVVAGDDGATVAGVQAVARWHGPDGAWRPAAEFAPLVARTGVGFSLELAILDQVVADAPTWHPRPRRLYVHASRSFLERRGVARFFAEVVGRGGVAAAALGLVVAAEDVVGRLELVQRPLWELHELGVHLVVGLGPTSPPMVPDLLEAVFDEVRLDPSFARSGHDADLAAIDDAVSRGHRHGMQVRLAGVGDADLAERAARLGVDLFEGPIASRLVEQGPTRSPVAR